MSYKYCNIHHLSIDHWQMLITTPRLWINSIMVVLLMVFHKSRILLPRVEDNVQDFDRRYGTSTRHNNYPLSSIVVLSACGSGVSPVILSSIDDEDNMGSSSFPFFYKYLGFCFLNSSIHANPKSE